MSLVIAAEPIPLTLDRDGVIRVGETRVTLESLLALYCQGATAEEIAQRYSAVALSDVYAVIGYYLRHRPDVEEYLAQSRLRSDEVRRQYASELDPHHIRDRLLARKSKQ
jgi:uncharacterized protein (DUF433 family)